MRIDDNHLNRKDIILKMSRFPRKLPLCSYKECTVNTVVYSFNWLCSAPLKL